MVQCRDQCWDQSFSLSTYPLLQTEDLDSTPTITTLGKIVLTSRTVEKLPRKAQSCNMAEKSGMKVNSEKPSW